MADRLYLDNAATTFPKPPGVAEAVRDYLENIGASPGRGGYAESVRGAEILAQCRERIRELVNAESANHIAFTLNGSDALNMALKGIVIHRRRANPRARVHLITTQMDHNSVLRPLNEMIQDGVRWTCIPADPQTGLIDPQNIASATVDETALVAVVHASNVSGTIQPIGEIASACRARGVPILVDAAQSLGHVPIDVRDMGIDLLAAPGHKGLLGPLGTGLLCMRPGMEHVLATYREGGTGSRSDEDVQPSAMPDRFEPGSHNMPAIAGLNESLRWLLDRGVDAIRAHELTLIDRVLGRLGELESAGYTLVGPHTANDRVGVFSFWHPDMPSGEIASALEQRGILVRAGLQCAPRAHRAMGTPPLDGAVRLSVSPFTSRDDIDRALDPLLEISKDLPPEVHIPSVRTSGRPTSRR